MKKEYTVETSTTGFYPMFLSCFKGYLGIEKQDDIALLTKLVDLAWGEDARAVINAATREDLCSALDLSDQNLSRGLKRLKDADLISGERGIYTISDKVFLKDKPFQENIHGALEKEGVSITITFKNKNGK